MRGLVNSIVVSEPMVQRKVRPTSCFESLPENGGQTTFSPAQLPAPSFVSKYEPYSTLSYIN